MTESEVQHKQGKNMAQDQRFCCINCGRPVTELYIQYSPGNIRLTKCDNCKSVADPYIECEFMIILIDLILHKTKAYRHLLFNMLNAGAGDTKDLLWKSGLLYFLLDAYRYFLLNDAENCWVSSMSLLVSISICGKALLLGVLFPNLIFISFVLIGTRLLLNSSMNLTRYKGIILAILISSYFKLFLVTMMVWKVPPSTLFIIDILVLSSNGLSLKVVTNLGNAGCLGTCFCAYTAKFFSQQCLHLVDDGSISKKATEISRSAQRRRRLKRMAAEV